MVRATVIVAALLASASPVFAHHGGGSFDSSRAVTRTGKLVKVDFINPHSWNRRTRDPNRGPVATRERGRPETGRVQGRSEDAPDRAQRRSEGDRTRA